jgi:hypothetical protein
VGGNEPYTISLVIRPSGANSQIAAAHHRIARPGGKPGHCWYGTAVAWTRSQARWCSSSPVTSSSSISYDAKIW